MLASCVAAIALASCGGDGDEAAERATTTAPRVAPAVREVTARISGRTLSGHCRGSRTDAPSVVLEVGMAADADQNQLAVLEVDLAQQTVVCAYDRAGVGRSDVAPEVPAAAVRCRCGPRRLHQRRETRAPAVPRRVLGRRRGCVPVRAGSSGHRRRLRLDEPVPPAKTFLPMARKVETKAEFESELALFHRGENEEGIVFTATERMLTDPLPPTMRYAVMFDEDCSGDTSFCRRILPPLTRATKLLANVGRTVASCLRRVRATTSSRPPQSWF